jgi:FixJ family two-component response regulator
MRKINFRQETAMSLTRNCPGLDPSTFSDAPTVFVVDGDASVRQALDPMIRSAGWQPRTAASAEEFLARPRVMSPSCVLAEVHLPGLTGIDLQSLIVERTAMPIILMSGRMDVQAAVQAMKGGAFEVLTKPLVTDVLLTTIRQAIDRSRAALNQLTHIQVLQARYASLSARERDVMSGVVSGRLNKQVGGDLGISEITVKAHRGKMMRKMQASSFAELVTMVASLHRWAATTAASVRLPPEPLADTDTFVQSLRFRTFNAMSL